MWQALRAAWLLLRTAWQHHVPTVWQALRAAWLFLRTVWQHHVRPAWQALRTACWPALLLAARTSVGALRTAWATRAQWRPALLLAARTSVGAFRTAWATRAQWRPALLLAGRTSVGALRTAWATRAQWWPVLVQGSRIGLREFWAAIRARATASPVLLLVLAVLLTTSWATRAADLRAQIAPAAHTAPPVAAPKIGPAPALETAPVPEAPQAPAAVQPCTVSTPAPPPAPAGLTPEQITNAQIIAQVAHERGLPERAVVIALATAQQESKLIDLGYGDRDSLGLFQQRPSMGWGTPQQVMDPAYAAGKFYDALVQVPGWDTGRLTDVAQAVQRSGYPELYQQWEGLATALAASVTPAAPAQPVCP